MTAWIISGLVMGGVGSLHCVGMCGPIALSLPSVNSSASSRFLGTLLYNTGRVVTYAVLGAILGMIGYSLVMMGFQKWLTITVGAGMLVFLFLPSQFKNRGGNLKFMISLRQKIARLYAHPSYPSLFLIGLFNGLLPCGLVYAALAVAVAGGSVPTSSLFMASFGAGTLPMMWMVAFFAGSIKYSFRVSLRKAYPFVIFIMGCVLILRGLNLGIPFISPALHEGHEHVAGIQCHD